MRVVVDDEIAGRCVPPFTGRGRLPNQSSNESMVVDKHVEQIILLVSHLRCRAAAGLEGCMVDRDDLRLVERYAQELRHQPSTAVWLLLYREGYDQFRRVRLQHTTSDRVGWSAACPTCSDGIAVFGERAIWNRFPRLEYAVHTHPYIHLEELYQQRYYWFHAALPLWFERWGECYPRAASSIRVAHGDRRFMGGDHCLPCHAREQRLVRRVASPPASCGQCAERPVQPLRLPDFLVAEQSVGARLRRPLQPPLSARCDGATVGCGRSGLRGDSSAGQLSQHHRLPPVAVQWPHEHLWCTRSVQAWAGRERVSRWLEMRGLPRVARHA